MLRKLKILYVVTQGELGGAQRYVFDLARNLDKSAYEVTVSAGTEKPELPMLLQQHGIKVKTVRHLRRNIHPLEDLLAIRELYELLKEIRPDIFHLNSSKAGVLGSFAAGLLGLKRVVFTAHGFAFLEPGSWPRRQVYFWAEKLATLFRKKIICVSDYDRQAAIRAGLCPPEKLVTIHNGTDPSTPSAKADSAQGIISLVPELARPPKPGEGWVEGLTIGTIANLYATKGLKYLVETAKRVVAKFPAARFVVIGEGREREKLESQISSLKLKDQFFLVGEKKDAARYLSSFDIFVLPSLKEGFPYTILEAMRAGLPIVATAVGGIPEAISSGREGLLVRPREPQALAEAILRLLRNPELAATLGRNAREKVKQFSLQRMLQKTEEVYREVMDRVLP